MELFDRILLMIHIPCGFISLILFLLPMFLKKGGKNHVRIGKAYVFCMWIVVITSIILSINNIYTKDYIPALFLGFLGFLTAKPLWYGISVLKQRKTVSESFKRINKALTALVFFMGLANILMAFSSYAKDDKILLMLFGILGLSLGKELFKKEVLPKDINFIREHLTGMVISGIASYTAFLSFGGRTILGDIFTGYWMLIPWVAPTVIGVVVIKYYKKKYPKKELAK